MTKQGSTSPITVSLLAYSKYRMLMIFRLRKDLYGNYACLRTVQGVYNSMNEQQKFKSGRPLLTLTIRFVRNPLDTRK